MDFMFWVWLGVIVVATIIEFSTMEVVSIWFTVGAIIPFILAATDSVRWEIQIVVFVIISALLIAFLRSLTKKFLLRNANEKTNVDSFIGRQFRMLERTDFENVGKIKIYDVIWSVIGLEQQVVEKGEIVEVVKVDGNKLVVRKIAGEEKIEEKKVEKVVTDSSKKASENVIGKIESKTSQNEKNVSIKRKTIKKSVENKEEK